LRSIFDVVEGAIDTLFLDRILGDLQARLRLLCLFLNAAGVYAVNRKVIVVAGTSGESNRPLVAAAVVLRERSQQGEGGPVAPIVCQIRNLIRPYHGSRLG
jgi:hypothetical protein